MSAVAAKRMQEQDAPSIRTSTFEVVPTRAQRRARPRVVYAAVGVVGIVVIMLAQLGLSLAVAEGAYTINSLEAEGRETARTVQELTEQQQTLGSVQNLQQQAAALGMVPNANQAYLHLADGRVDGTPVAAEAGEDVAANLVPNTLVAGAPLVADELAAEQAAREAAESAAAGAAGADAASGTVASTEDGPLVAPVTH